MPKAFPFLTFVFIHISLRIKGNIYYKNINAYFDCYKFWLKLSFFLFLFHQNYFLKLMIKIKFESQGFHLKVQCVISSVFLLDRRQSHHWPLTASGWRSEVKLRAFSFRMCCQIINGSLNGAIPEASVKVFLFVFHIVASFTNWILVCLWTFCALSAESSSIQV